MIPRPTPRSLPRMISPPAERPPPEEFRCRGPDGTRPAFRREKAGIVRDWGGRAGDRATTAMPPWLPRSALPVPETPPSAASRVRAAAKPAGGDRDKRSPHRLPEFARAFDRANKDRRIRSTTHHPFIGDRERLAGHSIPSQRFAGLDIKFGFCRRPQGRSVILDPLLDVSCFNRIRPRVT